MGLEAWTLLPGVAFSPPTEIAGKADSGLTEALSPEPAAGGKLAWGARRVGSAALKGADVGAREGGGAGMVIGMGDATEGAVGASTGGRPGNPAGSCAWASPPAASAAVNRPRIKAPRPAIRSFPAPSA